MSQSVDEYLWAQTTTERPSDELALAAVSWSLKVVVFTLNSGPMDRSRRPSRASRPGRCRRERRGRDWAAWNSGRPNQGRNKAFMAALLRKSGLVARCAWTRTIGDSRPAGAPRDRGAGGRCVAIDLRILA